MELKFSGEQGALDLEDTKILEAVGTQQIQVSKPLQRNASDPPHTSDERMPDCRAQTGEKRGLNCHADSSTLNPYKASGRESLPGGYSWVLTKGQKVRERNR